MLSSHRVLVRVRADGPSGVVGRIVEIGIHAHARTYPWATRWLACATPGMHRGARQRVLFDGLGLAAAGFTYNFGAVLLSRAPLAISENNHKVVLFRIKLCLAEVVPRGAPIQALCALDLDEVHRL